MRAASAAERARAGVEPQARALLRGLRSVRILPFKPVTGSYVPCGVRSTRLLYSADIFAEPAVPLNMASLGREVAAVLRVQGWKVATVNLRGVHVPLPTVPHPAYQLSRAGLQGVINILPRHRTGSQALVFVQSPCFDAGPMSGGLQKESLPD
jgi:hypothetical protein